MLIDFLKTLPEITEMMKNFMENHEEMLYTIASALRYEKVPIDRVVIKFGEKGKKFFLILQGRCSVLLPKEETVILTQEDYYNYLLRLKKFKEKEILGNVLTQNKNTYPLEEDEFSWLYGEIQTLKDSRNKVTPFENFLFKFAEEECIEEIENLDFDVWRIFENEKYLFNSFKYEQKVLSVEDYVNKQLSPTSWCTKAKGGKPVVAWAYHKVHSMRTGDKFGEISLTSTNHKRTATIVSETECHFVMLDKRTFVKCLKDASEKVKVKNMRCILSQKVFNDLNIHTFQRNYFNQFANKKLSIGDYLINEGIEADKIYVIKEGDYEVTIKASIMELAKLIRKLGDDKSQLPHESDLINGIF